MAKFPSDSPVNLTATDEAKIREMDMEQIKEFLKDRMVDQGLVTRDIYDHTVLLPVAQAEPSSAPLQRTITVNGTSVVLEAASEAELNAKETEFYRQIMNNAPTQTPAVEQPRSESGQFISQEDADLAQAWHDAAAEFLATTSPDEWWGGEESQQVIYNLLIENDLLEAEDKLDALRRAVAYAKENGLLPENPAIAARFTSARSPEEVRAAAYQSAGRLAPEARLEQHWNN
jgi:hypothetical protein